MRSVVEILWRRIKYGLWIVLLDPSSLVLIDCALISACEEVRDTSPLVVDVAQHGNIEESALFSPEKEIEASGKGLTQMSLSYLHVFNHFFHGFALELWIKISDAKN